MLNFPEEIRKGASKNPQLEQALKELDRMGVTHKITKLFSKIFEDESFFLNQSKSNIFFKLTRIGYIELTKEIQVKTSNKEYSKKYLASFTKNLTSLFSFIGN